MPEITLAKSLQVKNRLAGRLNRLQQDIEEFNSVLKEQLVNTISVEKLLKDRANVSNAIVELKTAIQKGSVEIQKTIYTLAERKGDILFYSRLRTLDGVVRHDYQAVFRITKVFVTYLDLDQDCKT